MGNNEAVDKWVKEQVTKLTNEVLDDYNKGKYTLEELKLFFSERDKEMKEWKEYIKQKESEHENE